MSGRRRQRANRARGRGGRRRGGPGRATAQTTRVVSAGRPFSGMFMPPVFRTSLRITFDRSAATATSLGQIAFSGNNVQDPTLSAGAEQPPGFTALATLYSRYRVIGSSCVIRGTLSNLNVGGNTMGAAELCLYPSNSSGAPGDFESAAAQPLAKFRELTSATPQVMNHAMSTALMTGQRNIVGADRLQSLVSTAPAEEWYWQVVFRSDAAYTSVNLDWHIQITYDVEFFDRPTINQASQSFKYIQLAYRARCHELKMEMDQEEKRRAEAKARVEEELMLTPADYKKHSDDISRELKEIEAYQRLHKTFEPADFKDSARGPLILDNTTVHEKWLKLREVDDQMPKETPKSRPPSRK